MDLDVSSCREQERESEGEERVLRCSGGARKTKKYELNNTSEGERLRATLRRAKVFKYRRTSKRCRTYNAKK